VVEVVKGVSLGLPGLPDRNLLRFVPASESVNDYRVTKLTALLQRLEKGDPHAAHELLPLVYEELRKLAAFKMANEAPGQTLQPTALVHEAWLRLGGDDQPAWENRGHFFAAAAEAMRRIVIDNARRKRRMRHGGDLERVDFAAIQVPAPVPAEEELLAVHEALDELAELDSRKAELVKLRFFVGLTFAEAATMLGVSEVTAKRDWAFARAWLYRRTGGGEPLGESKPAD
jgi:RNA polymerase sigma factor (TIGR02999 family)